MSEIFLNEVIDSGVLDEPYTIIRSTGTFQLGGWVTVETQIAGSGVVSVALEQDLLMIPEGDRVSGAMVFHSTKRIYMTQLDFDEGAGIGPSVQRVSDKMLWNYKTYRVLKVAPYPNRAYWRAIATRESGV